MKTRAPKQYRMNQILALASAQGFTDLIDLSEGRLVTAWQRWTLDGLEYIELKIARGRFAGNVAGMIHKPRPV